MNEHDNFEITKETWELLMEKLDDIHQQVKTTNGRVGSLERWRSYITGAIAIIAVVGGYFLVKIFEHIWVIKG